MTRNFTSARLTGNFRVWGINTSMRPRVPCASSSALTVYVTLRIQVNALGYRWYTLYNSQNMTLPAKETKRGRSKSAEIVGFLLFHFSRSNDFIAPKTCDLTEMATIPMRSDAFTALSGNRKRRLMEHNDTENSCEKTHW